MRVALAAAAAVLTISAGSAPQTDSLDAYLTGLSRRGTFSGAVLVARGDQILLSKGYGLADIASRTPNTTATRFRISWLGFDLGNAAVLRLAAEGKLDVDASICDYIPSCPARWRPWTVARIMRGGGVLDLPPKPDESRLWSLEKWMRLLRTRSFNPRHDVSVTSQVLFAYLVEQVTHRRWQDYLRDAVLRPAGMTSTTYDAGRPGGGEATPYLLSDSGGWLPTTVSNLGPKAPSDHLSSTALDLYRFDRAAYGGKLLSPELIELLRDGHEQLSEDSGTNARGERGWDAYYESYPSSGLVLIVLGNTNGIPMRDIANTLRILALDPSRTAPTVPMPSALPLEPVQTRSLAGTYAGLFHGNASYELRLTYRGGRLLVSPSPVGTTETGAERLIRVGPSSFAVARAPGYRLSFHGRTRLTLSIAFDAGQAVAARFARERPNYVRK